MTLHGFARAGADLAGACRPCDAGARRHLDRRGRRLRAARARTAPARPAAAARLRREQRRLPHVRAASGSAGAIARDARGARPRRAGAAATSTTSTCTAPAPGQRRGGGRRRRRGVRHRDAVQLHQGLDRPHARRRRASLEAVIAALCIAHGFVPGCLNVDRARPGLSRATSSLDELGRPGAARREQLLRLRRQQLQPDPGRPA